MWLCCSGGLRAKETWVCHIRSSVEDSQAGGCLLVVTASKQSSTSHVGWKQAEQTLGIFSPCCLWLPSFLFLGGETFCSFSWDVLRCLRISGLWLLFSQGTSVHASWVESMLHKVDILVFLSTNSLHWRGRDLQLKLREKLFPAGIFTNNLESCMPYIILPCLMETLCISTWRSGIWRNPGMSRCRRLKGMDLLSLSYDVKMHQKRIKNTD